MENCLSLEGDLNGSDNIWKNIAIDLNTWQNLPVSPAVDSFSLDGEKVWVKVDFAYREVEGSIHLIDWKSGQSKGKPDPIQLNIYGYYASEVWGIPEEKIYLTAYNVNQDEQYDRTFSEKQKQETRETILSSIEEMKKMLSDKDANEANEEDFRR